MSTGSTRRSRREATVRAEQLIAIAKVEAALFVHGVDILGQLMDRVWGAIRPSPPVAHSMLNPGQPQYREIEGGLSHVDYDQQRAGELFALVCGQRKIGQCPINSMNGTAVPEQSHAA